MHATLDKKITGRFLEIAENARSLSDLEARLEALNERLRTTTSWATQQDIEDEIRFVEDRIAYVRSGREEVDFLIDLIPIAQKYEPPPPPPPPPQPSPAGGGILGFVKVDSKKETRALLEAFDNRGDQQSASRRDEAVGNADVCPRCGGDHFDLDRREARCVCVRCGFTEVDMDAWIQNVSYNDQFSMMTRTSSYAYKKINHFAEWLASVQAKEKTTIPDEVLDALRVEYKKIRVSRASDITPAKTKEFLKKLKMTKYYEHVHYITELLSGIPPVSIPPVLEDRLKAMFHEIQRPWEKTKPANRSNFFSYSYVLHKFCELLGEDEYLPLFPLLKSSQKLYQQDQMWKAVCAELGWEFISSV